MLPIITITGNVAADPILRYTDNGAPVCNFTIYANGRTSQTPVGEQHTERVKCTCWGKAAETASQYIKKGMPVTVSGEATTEPYMTRAGLPAANFKVERATFYLIKTGNGNDRANSAEEPNMADDPGDQPASAPDPALAQPPF